MHTIYDEANLPINTYSVTLLSNYRCHSGVLMLPSNLFYRSTLKCCVPDSERHPDAPFPLVFVCSSLEEDIRNVEGVNEVEIAAVMDQVEHYFSVWPKQWDKEDKVCIMSPSANQVIFAILIHAYILNKLYSAVFENSEQYKTKKACMLFSRSLEII